MSNAPDDFIDIVRCLREATCEFIVVGAYALAANGYPRATQDLDILVSPTPANAASVLRALTAFGAPIAAHGITAADFETPGNVYQIGLPPIRIDILTSIEGVTFAEAVADHVEGDIGGEPVRFIGREAQIRNKRATGRTKPSVPTSCETAPPGYLCSDGRRLDPRPCRSLPSYLVLKPRPATPLARGLA